MKYRFKIIENFVSCLILSLYCYNIVITGFSVNISKGKLKMGNVEITRLDNYNTV